jgi:hypothetical protein
MYHMELFWLDDNKETWKLRVKNYEFDGGFFVLVDAEDAIIALPHSVIYSVKLRELTEEEEEEARLGYRPETTFREGEKSPWFPAMGVPKDEET